MYHIITYNSNSYYLSIRKTEVSLYKKRLSSVIQNVKNICIDFNDDVNRQVLENIYKLNIGSVLIEGGNYLISSFVEKGLWDEAFIEISDDKIGCGISAPLINGDVINAKKYIDSLHFHIKRGFNRKFKLNTMLSMV